MATKYAAEWAKATKEYEASVKTLHETLPGEYKTEFSQASKMLALFKKVDKQKKFSEIIGAIHDAQNSGELEKSFAQLDKISAGVESAWKDAKAAAKTAAKGGKPKSQVAFPAETSAAEDCRQKLQKIFAAMLADSNELLTAAGKTHSVAFVKLLPPDILASVKDTFDVKALGRYVVEVEVKLPKPVLDDLAEGIEGVSLATMQVVAERAVVPFRNKALAELDFVKANLHDFPEFQAGYDITLKKYTASASEASSKAIEAHWADLVRAQKKFEKIQIKAGATYVLGILSLAASITTLVLSLGAAIPAYVSLAKSILSIASTLRMLSKSIDSTAESVHEQVTALREELEDSEASKTTRAVEVANILGVPFMKGCKAALEEIDLLEGKISEMEEEVKDLIREANAGMKILENISDFPNKEKQAQIAKLRKSNGELLNAIAGMTEGRVVYMALVNSARPVVNNLKQEKLSRYDRLSRKVDMASSAASVYGVASNLATFAQAIM